MICCQNNKRDVWFAGNNAESHWLTLLPSMHKSAFSV